MTFRKFEEQSDDVTWPSGQSEIPASSEQDLLPVDPEDPLTPDEIEEYEMMLASLEDFELEDIAVRKAMSDFKFDNNI